MHVLAALGLGNHDSLRSDIVVMKAVSNIHSDA
jgi:hypothetical protein